MRFAVLVEVTGRAGVADPEGATIERSLPALGFMGVSELHVGKAIRFLLDAPDERAARRQAEEMCNRLLANPVIEDARVSVGADPPEAAVGTGEAVAR